MRREHNIDLATKLERLINTAIAHKIASSISLCLSYGSKHSRSEDSSADLIINRGSTNKHPLVLTSDETIYDLASLTKIMGTTLALGRAVLEQRLDLSERPWASWPDLSIEDLLAHRSGLAAHVKFYLASGISKTNFTSNRQLIFAELFKQKASNNRARLYSDLNFLALGWLLEERYKQNLGEIFLDTWQWANLGSELRIFPSAQALVRPLELAPTKRGQKLAQVHDQNCYYLGGLAGHAGLFGQLSHVAAFGRWLLEALRSPQNSSLKSPLKSNIGEAQSLIAEWARAGLGFDQPSKQGSVRALSPSARGHFGFTGTSLWVDPKLGLHGTAVTLLTNRVEQSLKPAGIFWLRSRVHELIGASLRA